MKHSKRSSVSHLRTDWEGEKKGLPVFLADPVKWQQRPKIILRLCPHWDSKTVQRSSVLHYARS